VPYADVAHIILPILLAGDPDGSGYESEDDIMITIDAEAEEQARAEEEATEQQRIKEIQRELEESSKEAGLFLLPPIASILPSRGKGRVGTSATTREAHLCQKDPQTLEAYLCRGVPIRLGVHQCRVIHLLL